MCESSPTRTFSRSQPLSPSRFTNRFFAEYVYLNQLILGILTAWMNIEKKILVATTCCWIEIALRKLHLSVGETQMCT